MAQSKNSFLSALASSVTSSGTVPSAALAPEVTSSIEGAGTAVYDSAGLLPISGNTAGDTAFVKSTSRLYIHSGVGWYNVAVINNTPTVQSITDSDGGTTPFSLATDGTPTTITITAQDSDGDPLTYNYSADSNFGGLATLSQDGNVFTITPYSEDSATTTSGTITFSVTDGINTATPGAQTFTLTFAPDWTATTQQAKIQASNAGAADYFGWSVAVDTDIAIVGAYEEDTSGTNAGSAYVFTRSGSTWTQQAQIQSSDIAAGDRFGHGVAISGNTAVVGAFLENSEVGSAYVFVTSDGGSTWTQQAKLTPSDSPATAQFGRVVAIDGDTVVIGAHYEDTSGINSGAAYIFTRSGSTWTQQAKIKASDASQDDNFGWSVDISGDTVIIGAIYQDASFSQAGAAYIFTRSGSTWTQQAKLVSSDIAENHQFGKSVGIDGDTAIVGAWYANSFWGAAYIFTRSGSTWTQQAKIQSSDIEASDVFGSEVAIEGDVAIVSANGEDTGGSAAGAVYIFTTSDGGSTWTEQTKIQASDKGASDEFGYSAAISGTTVIVGAPREDTGADNAGAAYIFTAG